MPKVPMKLEVADRLAAAILDNIRPACTRAEVAGSIRRRKPVCGDVEIVCVSKIDPGGLFGDLKKPTLFPVLESLVKAGKLIYLQGGEKMRRYQIVKSEGTCLDLHIVSPETWGVLFAIRTGSAEFAKTLVTQRCQRGRLDDGLVVKDGRVWTIGADGAERTALNTPEEQDFFAVAGGYVPPEKRIA